MDYRHNHIDNSNMSDVVKVRSYSVLFAICDNNDSFELLSTEKVSILSVGLTSHQGDNCFGHA